MSNNRFSKCCPSGSPLSSICSKIPNFISLSSQRLCLCGSRSMRAEISVRCVSPLGYAASNEISSRHHNDRVRSKHNEVPRSVVGQRFRSSQGAVGLRQAGLHGAPSRVGVAHVDPATASSTSLRRPATATEIAVAQQSEGDRLSESCSLAGEQRSLAPIG